MAKIVPLYSKIKPRQIDTKFVESLSESIMDMVKVLREIEEHIDVEDEGAVRNTRTNLDKIRVLQRK